MSDSLDLARAAHDVDGVEPFNEATRIALREGADLRVDVREEHAAAVAAGDSPVELVVHPDHRRQSLGGAILRALLERGETRYWAHGDLPGAQALARSAGLAAERTLLVLRLAMTREPEHEHEVAGVTIRSFTETDADAIVAVNGRAFAAHPEQGGMDRADFDRRRAEAWFDPAGLFVAEREGEVAGFHWTKVVGDIGEVYVVGVDPAAHGGGLGTALTARGIRHLWDQGLRTVDLYVEGDNDPALAVYRRRGFTERARDTLYAVPG